MKIAVIRHYGGVGLEKTSVSYKMCTQDVHLIRFYKETRTLWGTVLAAMYAVS